MWFDGQSVTRMVVPFSNKISRCSLDSPHGNHKILSPNFHLLPIYLCESCPSRFSVDIIIANWDPH